MARMMQLLSCIPHPPPSELTPSGSPDSASNRLDKGGVPKWGQYRERSWGTQEVALSLGPRIGASP